MSQAAKESNPHHVEQLLAETPGLPRHVAIIMDGNGRWAESQGLPRVMGHKRGAETVDMIVTRCRELGIGALTLYSFSSENWKRPPQEVEFLMQLCIDHLKSQRDRLIENDVRFKWIGRKAELPSALLTELDETTRATEKCSGMTLCLAINYGARQELSDAVTEIAHRVSRGELQPEDVSEKLIEEHLYTAGIPDPDLLLRTAGEMRISNFLLWQISYSELVVTDVLWPEFGKSDFDDAMRQYASRERRYGGLASS